MDAKTLLGNRHLYASTHAVVRLRERYGSVLNGTISENERKTRLEYIVRNGTVLTEWRRCPFYVNKLAHQNAGQHIEYIHCMKKFFAVVAVEPSKAIILTVVDNILNYSGSSDVITIPTPAGARLVSSQKYFATLEHRAIEEYKARHGNTPNGVYAEAEQAKRKAAVAVKAAEQAHELTAPKKVKPKDHIYPQLPAGWQRPHKQYYAKRDMRKFTRALRVDFFKDVFRVVPVEIAPLFAAQERILIEQVDTAVNRIKKLERQLKKGGNAPTSDVITAALASAETAVFNYNAHLKNFGIEVKKGVDTDD